MSELLLDTLGMQGLNWRIVECLRTRDLHKLRATCKALHSPAAEAGGKLRQQETPQIVTPSMIDYIHDRELLLVLSCSPNLYQKMIPLLIRKASSSNEQHPQGEALYRIESEGETISSIHHMYAGFVGDGYWGIERFADYHQIIERSLETEFGLCLDLAQEIRQQAATSDDDTTTTSKVKRQKRAWHSCAAKTCSGTSTASGVLLAPYQVNGNFYCGQCLDTSLYLRIQFGMQHPHLEPSEPADWEIQEQDITEVVAADEFAVQLFRTCGMASVSYGTTK